MLVWTKSCNSASLVWTFAEDQKQVAFLFERLVGLYHTAISMGKLLSWCGMMFDMHKVHGEGTPPSHYAR